MNRYLLELKRFKQMHGESVELFAVCDMLSEGAWYSWQQCRRVLRCLDRPKRSAAAKLLKAAQVQRKINYFQYMGYDATGKKKQPSEYTSAIAKYYDPLRFYVAPVAKELYNVRCQPLVMNGRRIGLTIFAKRIRGGMAKVFYKSRFGLALRHVGFKAAVKDSIFTPLDGWHHKVTEFHVSMINDKAVS